MKVFFALALYSAGSGRAAIKLLLRQLAETTKDKDITQYKKALLFYAERL